MIAKVGFAHHRKNIKIIKEENIKMEEWWDDVRKNFKSRFIYYIKTMWLFWFIAFVSFILLKLLFN